MSDDFNTALATSSMFGLAKEINIYYQAVTGREGVVCQEAIAEVKRIFKFMTEVIGILEKHGKAILVLTLLNTKN